MTTERLLYYRLNSMVLVNEQIIVPDGTYKLAAQLGNPGNYIGIDQTQNFFTFEGF